MYKVFIVEDEHLIRDSIRNEIIENSEALDLKFCGEAGDGELGLSMMMDLKPDILITDIRMPFMDGLQLAKEAKEIFPWIRIIIISGFDEFDYAKQALQLGVDDYLLKPIKSAELYTALRKSIDAFNEQNQNENHYPGNTDAIMSVMSRNNFLEALFQGQLKVDKAIERAKELGVDLVGKKYTVLLVSAKPEKEISDYHRYYDRLASVLTDDVSCIFSTMSTKYIKLLLFDANREALLEKSYQLAHFILHELDRDGQFELGVAIGPIVNRISEIKQCFDSTNLMMKSYGVLRPDNILSCEDDLRDGELSPTNPFNKDFIVKLNESSKEDIPQLLELLSYFPEDAHPSEARNRVYRYFVLLELLTIVRKKELQVEGFDFQFLNEPESISAISNNVTQYQALLNNLLEIILNTKIDPSMARYRSVITQALKVIDENYSSPDISLNYVAEEIALSPSHFSTIFSQAMNMTFIEYITNKRITLAKKLLRETNEKLGNIAFEIGYSDPNYFSFLFKRKENMSPTEYRKQCANN
ncbi:MULTISPECIES: response regulator [unclassified Breznakia]|uniref:response regulator n=1 Tax=unclassified Breznakia TaxID=2623764 RepID=UPI0024761BB5|nr:MULTISPECIES: response regulator [unclassified Breznakia]MDH6366545.1 two-component system response regulator YesN [Breznakia sp. PH1-1]MDH6403638.1 two-component system response regulator YesN [Breznakia sp. PF1-11]MDH6411347.1 two-component system response regulator YesN [Breznakia sp. PFB1-11]MDH6413677.1 two-component system response regulator YesN [Breznakia sp. PFB1-14]MDH6415892.1 two-component system response regulator YesN [Breznakia sp. PFB1-4]